MEQSSQLGREQTLAYLEREAAVWTGLRARADRYCGMSEDLNQLRDESLQRLDSLLDDLYAQTVILQTAPITE